jgi:predicted nucleic acid-binding protein
MLFESALRGRVTLHISAVNLAEVLQHAAADFRTTGLDPVAVLDGFKVAVHRPDTDVARAVAALGGLPRLSLPDRFAAATAQVLGARLHTTDGTLAAALRARRIPVTLY